MKYYLLAVICALVLVSGCDKADRPDRVRLSRTTGKYITKHWEDGRISCVTIEGHRYILTHVAGYTDGPSGIVHAESCQCKQ